MEIHVLSLFFAIALIGVGVLSFWAGLFFDPKTPKSKASALIAQRFIAGDKVWWTVGKETANMVVRDVDNETYFLITDKDDLNYKDGNLTKVYPVHFENAQVQLAHRTEYGVLDLK